MTQRALLLATCTGLLILGWILLRPERIAPPVSSRVAAERPELPRAAEARLPPVLPPLLHEVGRPGKLRLEGQVIDEDELPVRDAQVALDTVPRRTAVTREDGTFEFPGLPGRVYAIQARRGAQMAGPVSAALTASSEPVVLRLRTGSTIEVRVLERRGQRPVAGAWVELRSLVRVNERTDSDGRALLAGVASGTHGLKVSAPGFADEFKMVSSGGPGIAKKELVLLESGATLSGTAVDEAGNPVGGATVWLEEANRLTSSVDPASDGVLSDESGRWRIEAVPRGTFHVAAAHPDHAPALSAAIAADGIGDRSGIVITLQPGAQIRGRVLGEDGRGEDRALVRVAHADTFGRTRVREVQPGPDGYFEVGGLPRRPVQLMALTETAVSEVEVLDLRPGARGVQVVLRLVGCCAIDGVVVTPAGRPISEAQIVAVSATAGADLQRAALRGQLAAVADASGRFRIAGLEAGPFRLRTAWPGTAPGTAGVLVSAPSSGVKLVADAPGRVHGCVVFGSGGSPTIFSVGLPLAASTTFIETNGAFVLHDVPAGHHSVVFSSPEFVTRSIEGVSVPPAGDADIGTISVDSGRAVSGYVLDTGGRPVPGARVGGGQILIADGVEVGGHGDFPEWMGMLKTTSGDDGRFLLNGIPRDPFLVVAEADEGRSQFTRVAGGDESVELNLRLEPPGSVQGRVSRGGQPAPDAVVSATPQGVAGSHLIVRSAMDGSYKLDKLAPGTYLLTATIAAAGSATSTTVPLSVVAGEGSHVDLNIQAGSVTLHVSAPKPDVTAQVLLLAFRGDLPVRTVAELQAFLADHGSPSSRIGLIAQGNEAVLVDVTPGQYQLCHVVLSAGDLANREVLENLQRNAGKLPVSCQPLQVPDGVPDYGVSVTL